MPRREAHPPSWPGAAILELCADLWRLTILITIDQKNLKLCDILRVFMLKLLRKRMQLLSLLME